MVFNKVILGNWLWRFRIEKYSFLRKVVVEKYGTLEGVGGLKMSLFFMCANIGGIFKGWKESTVDASFKVRDGRMSFWGRSGV